MTGTRFQREDPIIMEMTKRCPGAEEQESGVPPREFMGSFFVAMLSLQGVNHGFRLASSGNPHWIMPHLVSLAHDGVILTCLYFLSVWGAAALAGRIGGSAIRRLLIGLWVPPMTVLMMHPRFIPNFLHFPVNLLALDAGSAATFVRHFLTWREIVIPPLFIIMFGIFLLPVVRPRIPGLPLPILALFVAVSAVTLARPSPNPFVFAVQESLVHLVRGERRVVPTLQRWSPDEGIEVAPAPEAFSRVCSAVASADRISHILVIVMETVEQSRFQKHLLDNPATFIGGRRSRFRTFTRYHTPNLDSYTSLVAMLTGVAVPFQAYHDPQRFAGVDRAPNLPEILRSRGWKSAFVCTARHQPFVPVRQSWDRIIEGNDLPENPSFIGIDSPPIEAGVEDRAARPAILEFMRSTPKSLVLQECLFGHTQAWMDLTRLSQLDYVDRYLQELDQSVESLGLRDSTLLVVVADHGSREDAGNPENYRIPLLMAGPGISPGLDDRFLSHTDFCGLLGEAVSRRVRVQPTQELLTVGHSGSWVYGRIRADASCQFIDNSRGELLESNGNLDPAVLHRTFQQRLSGFIRRFPDPRSEGLCIPEETADRCLRPEGGAPSEGAFHLPSCGNVQVFQGSPPPPDAIAFPRR